MSDVRPHERNRARSQICLHAEGIVGRIQRTDLFLISTLTRFGGRVGLGTNRNSLSFRQLAGARLGSTIAYPRKSGQKASEALCFHVRHTRRAPRIARITGRNHPWKSAFVIARGPWEVPGGRWSMAVGVGCIPVALSGAPQLSLQFATRDRSRHAAQSAALRWHSLRGRGRPVVAMRPNHLSSGLREKPRSPLTSTLNLHFE